jgi:hypothetical protein
MAGYIDPYPGMEDPTHAMGGWGLNAPSITSGDVFWAAPVPPAVRGAYGLYSAIRSLLNPNPQKTQMDILREQLKAKGHDPNKVLSPGKKATVTDITKNVVDFDEEAYRQWLDDPTNWAEGTDWSEILGVEDHYKMLERGLIDEEDIIDRDPTAGFTDDELLGLLEEYIGPKRPTGKPDLYIVRDDEDGTNGGRD